ncbi:MAG TPA: DUF1178 family protein [Dongiaceae bacterium]|jgi:hypothetical protein
MILYQLRCAKDHEFEAWFKDGQTCEHQLARKSIECPTCGNRKVSKALMAPRLGASEKKQAASLPAKPAAGGQHPMSVMASAMRQHLQEIRAKVEENCDYVGEKFPEEARKIHYGETEARGIYGEASDEQHQELIEEGVEVARIPWLPRSDA